MIFYSHYKKIRRERKIALEDISKRTKIDIPFKEIKYIHHISDVHIRNLKRHAEYEQVFEKLYEKIKENNITMVQLAQAFVNSRPFVTSNIIGATSMDQLKENIGSINVKLNQDTLDKINLIHNNNPNPAP